MTFAEARAELKKLVGEDKVISLVYSVLEFPDGEKKQDCYMSYHKSLNEVISSGTCRSWDGAIQKIRDGIIVQSNQEPAE